MGSSTTTKPATGGDPPAPRPGASSRILRFVARLVLGVAGFAGFALLGAGGAWLFKHYVANAPGAPAVQVAPAARPRPEVARPAPSAALPAAPPAQAPVAPPQASAPVPEAAPVAALPERDPTVDAPTSAGPTAYHAPVRTAHGADPHARPTPAHADRAACQARVNAITADLSLRNEPPTPEQLAILKRGCK